MPLPNDYHNGLSALVGVTFATDRHLIGLERSPTVDVAIKAHQWWWEIRYADPVPSRGFTTARAFSP